MQKIDRALPDEVRAMFAASFAEAREPGWSPCAQDHRAAAWSPRRA